MCIEYRYPSDRSCIGQSATNQSEAIPNEKNAVRRRRSERSAVDAGTWRRTATTYTAQTPPRSSHTSGCGCQVGNGYPVNTLKMRSTIR